MNTRRTIALLLVLAMAACLPGCAGKKQKEAEPGKTVILMEQDDAMINTYTLIAVDPEAPFADADGNPVADVYVNTDGADALIRFLLSDEGIDLAAKYGKEDFGDSLFYVKDGHPSFSGTIAKAEPGKEVVRLSTTTSVKDSGLLGFLLPVFEKEYGYTVEVQSAGTGKAISAAKLGNADLILVHAKAKEEEFVAGGFARVLPEFDSERLSFLYNYFVLCGPESDPAGAAAAENVKEAFRRIAEGKHVFVSRGDGSGTHTKELSMWPAELGITEDPESFKAYEWYHSANAGMSASLLMAQQAGGYILSDKATFLTFQKNGGAAG
ncbi:MAG: substrate-binding domain-containing protein [Clostridia bacterium]|nr:substrate-binding domain-containing protein [Bacillota bacterium]MBR0445121.1 substrate-binding domain-containing protein [Clostridia bacterium]